MINIYNFKFNFYYHSLIFFWQWQWQFYIYIYWPPFDLIWLCSYIDCSFFQTHERTDEHNNNNPNLTLRSSTDCFVSSRAWTVTAWACVARAISYIHPIGNLFVFLSLAYTILNDRWSTTTATKTHYTTMWTLNMVSPTQTHTPSPSSMQLSTLHIHYYYKYYYHLLELLLLSTIMVYYYWVKRERERKRDLHSLSLSLPLNDAYIIKHVINVTCFRDHRKKSIS